MLKLVIRSQEKRTKEEGRKKTYKNKSKTTKKMATGTRAALYSACLAAQWCPTLCNPMNCSQAPLSMGILQARILELVAMPFSRGSSTQGSNPGLPHCRWVLYHLSPPQKSKNTEVGSLSLLQGIFPTQERNRGLLHCR